MIKPTIETQISSTLCAEGAEMYDKNDLFPFIIVDYVRESYYFLAHVMPYLQLDLLYTSPLSFPE